MISNIKIKFGTTSEINKTTIDVTPITIFVGPNNSGKSKVLSEIYQFCNNGRKNANNFIIDNIELNEININEIDAIIQSIILKPETDDVLEVDNIFVGKKGDKLVIGQNSLKDSLLKPNDSGNSIVACMYYLKYKTLLLNGKNRIELIEDQHAGNLQSEPQTSFQILFRQDELRKQVRKIVYEAFGHYLVVDPTELGMLKLKLSLIPPKDDMEERGIHAEAVEFHSKASPISQSSDGVKAFTGMLIEILAGDPSILLIDEPEAFLHPALSFKLGKEISRLSTISQKRLLVSTHSSSFVMGCIQSGAQVNIVRLTHRDNVSTAKVLPNQDILKLMRNPLLRSTGVLNGLFYEFVIVTESDTDRAFYQEINERLLQDDNRGIPNCLFLHAQNKQTIKTIIKPLREIGIPVAGIVDIDIIKEGGKVWTSFLDSAFIPSMELESLATLRTLIKKKFDETGKDMKTDGGETILENGDREAFNNLLNKLKDYGLFVVPIGELESWLSDLKVEKHGPDWLVEIFEKMGEDPDIESYRKPTDADVWAFLDDVTKWFLNTKRKGIPLLLKKDTA
ncbi:AAA ATPase-like protein [Nitrosomonas sp. Nm84]|uniref:ATP-dependent nuclease n=1 Tax=Nitrosomonas sp. Nm84 TaxID=200124 RepID=UPI000D75B372|nr:AAA family ATPase [Nitrosomonas sp. Nm84]PXW89132.1 AAA ATPase-like protein [Nitrosomonas sp. Nm84]